MGTFREALFATKRISIWGIGYLGYTTILRLQSKGFTINCSTFDKDVQQDIYADKYPYEYMKQTWSLNNDLPKINLEKILFCTDFEAMFETEVHVIALPAFGESGKPEAYHKLVEIFSAHAKKLKHSLVLFQSAEKIGTVDDYFIKPLQKKGVNCHFASAFRSDWNLEEFLIGNETRILAANNKASLHLASEFFEIMEVKYKTLQGIKEAEIYENAKNCLKYTTEAFFTQLSLAYPDINLNEVSSLIVSNLDLSTKRTGLNLLNHKNILHVNNILAAPRGDYLSIIKETQAVNMTTVLFYADILKQKKIASATIMGISVEGAQKDIRASAAVLCAEYMNSIGMKVFVHDPYFTEEEIRSIMPFSTITSLHNKAELTQAYIMMSSNPVYGYFTQKDIEKNGLFDAKIIIDGTGILKHLSFSKDTLYHQVGDGELKALLK